MKHYSISSKDVHAREKHFHWCKNCPDYPKVEIEEGVTESLIVVDEEPDSFQKCLACARLEAENNCERVINYLQ